MKKTRKTEINLEIAEAITIQTKRSVMSACLRCQRQVRMVSANEAAVIVRRSAREIYRLVEAGSLHFIEDRDGLLFVCIASLEQFFEEGLSASEDERQIHERRDESH